MKLELPAERPLQHPGRMVDAILTEVPQRRPIRPAMKSSPVFEFRPTDDRPLSP